MGGVKTGRPRLARGEATHRVVVLLSDSQLAAVREAATRAGTTVSGLIRNMLTGRIMFPAESTRVDGDGR